MSGHFTAVDVIATKRDGGRLSDGQIDWVVDAYTRGVVADEQMAALAMAILLRGMTPGEIARWTAAMIASGERLDLSGIPRPTVDKHSTGGVGDKITLPLTPLVVGEVAEEDGHRERGHLAVGEPAVGDAVREEADLVVAQRPAVALGDDHLDGVVGFGHGSSVSTGSTSGWVVTGTLR